MAEDPGGGELAVRNECRPKSSETERHLYVFMFDMVNTPFYGVSSICMPGAGVRELGSGGFFHVAIYETPSIGLTPFSCSRLIGLRRHSGAAPEDARPRRNSINGFSL